MSDGLTPHSAAQDTAPPPAPVPSRKPGPGFFAAVGWIFVFLIVQLPFFLLAVIMAGSRKDTFKLPALTVSGFIAAALLVAWKYRGSVRRTLGLHGVAWLHAACVVLIVLPLALFNSVLATWIESAYSLAGVTWTMESPKLYGDFLAAAKQLGFWWELSLVLLFCGVLPGIYEEVLCRGFIGRGLVAKYGVVWGVALTAILFGALHPHPIQAPITALIGVLLHAVYLITRSLLAPILLHCLNNCLAFMGDHLLSYASARFNESEQCPPHLVLAAAAALLVVGWLMARTRVRWRLPDGGEWSPGYTTAEMPPVGADAKPVRPAASPRILWIAAAAYIVFVAVLTWEASL